jgi:hypothetical protein
MRCAARLRGVLHAPALLFRAVRPASGVFVGRNPGEHEDFLPANGPGDLVACSVFGEVALRPGRDR